MLLTTCVEKLIPNLEEIKALNLVHYDEISTHKIHGFKLDPDYDKYAEREDRGELLYVTLRNQGKLVGYYIGFVGRALHYQGCVQAQMDIIYVEPVARGNKGGMLVGLAVKAEHRRRGVNFMTMGFKTAHAPFMKALLEELGMQPFEVHYGLWL